MNKKEVQQRVSQFGKKLELNKFSWDEKTLVFSSTENNLVIDFAGVNGVTIISGNNSVQIAGNNSTQIAGNNSTQTDAISFAIFSKEPSTIQITPYDINGYIKDGIYSETGKPAIIADGILSHIIKKKGNVYKVKNHKDDFESYLIEIDGIYSHGKTLKEAKESYKYKIADRDTSKYNDFTLATKLTETEAIQMYRTITGSCEGGTKYFVENLKNKPKNITVEGLIELTKGQYNHNLLVDFFNK